MRPRRPASAHCPAATGSFLQTEVHPYHQEKELKNFLSSEGMVIQAWYPLGHGDKALLEEPVFAGLSHKYNKSSAQIILR